jgi:hypothetical protein
MEIKETLFVKALEYLNSAEAFVKAEVPAFVSELLRFKVFEHLVDYFDDIIGWLIVSAVLTHIFNKCRQHIKAIEDKQDRKEPLSRKEDSDLYAWNETIRGALGFVIAISWAVTLLCAVATTHLMSAYKAYTAPRVYLMDYVKESISSNSDKK